MVADNIKKFLKQKINKESNSDILDELYKELYKISKTQEDYSFLFDKLIEKGSEEHNYSSLKLLCIISIKLSKEQEAYDQILEYSKNSPESITILSILSIMETFDSIQASSNYFDLNRDISVFDIPKTRDVFSPLNIIKYIEDSAQEHYEPPEQSISNGSVFYLKKQNNKNLGEFVDQILRYFKKAQQNIIKE